MYERKTVKKRKYELILPCTTTNCFFGERTTVALVEDEVELAGVDWAPVVGCTSVNFIALDADDWLVTMVTDEGVAINHK